MKPWSSKAQALLDLAEHEPLPSREVLDRTRRTVLARAAAVGTAAALTASGQAKAAFAASGTAKSALLGGVAGSKLVTLCVLGAVAGAGITVLWNVSRPRSPESTPPSVTSHGVANQPSAASPSRSSPVAVAEPASGRSDIVVPSAATTVRSRDAESSVSLASADPPWLREPSRAGSGSALATQVEVLRRANRELSEGRPGQALATIEGRSELFAGTPLQEEAEAARTLATCQTYREARAASALAAFLANWPHSPYAPRIRAECGDGLSDQPRSSNDSPTGVGASGHE